MVEEAGAGSPDDAPPPPPQVTKEQVREEVHELLLFAKQRATAITDGFSVLQSTQAGTTAASALRKTTMHPDLRSYSPQSGAEIEIQSFNTALRPPGRFLTADALADWLLDPAQDELNRRSVALFLSLPASAESAATLETLANKVCRADKVANGSFIEALKTFLPVSGCLDLALCDGVGGRESSTQFEEQQLVLLRALVFAFQRHNKSAQSSLYGPESPSSSRNVAATTAAKGDDSPSAKLFVRIGSLVLGAACTMLSQPHVLSEVRDAFRSALDAAHTETASLAEPADRAAMSAAFEAELFSVRPLAPLARVRSGRVPPSYLFSQPLLWAWGILRSTPSDDPEPAFLVLTRDALYCFDDDISAPLPLGSSSSSSGGGGGGNRFPRSTIPLAQCNVHAELARATPSLELTSTSGDPLVMLSNSGGRREDAAASLGEEWWGATGVAYRPAVLLEVRGDLGAWLAAIEESAWASRTAAVAH